MCSQQCPRCSPLNATATHFSHRTLHLRHKARCKVFFLLFTQRCPPLLRFALIWCLMLSLLWPVVVQCTSPPPRSTPPPPNAKAQQYRAARSSPVPQLAVPPDDHHSRLVTQFASSPRQRTFSLLFPVPTVVSQVNTNRKAATSPPANSATSTDHVAELFATLPPRPTNSLTGSPITPTNDSASAQNVPKTNQSKSTVGDQLPTEPGEPSRTTVLEILDRSPLILNLPISVHHHLEPLVQRILSNGTAEVNRTSTSLDSTVADEEDSGNSTAGNHLFRAGRQTHQDFIKRILNAVSVDSHNVNRYVHLIRPKGRPHLTADSTDHVDLGLPADMADEYIDGVNPPKFPNGLKVYQPLIEKNDWRGPMRPIQPKPIGPVVSVVDPESETASNVYSQPLLVYDKPQSGSGTSPLSPAPSSTPAPSAQPLPRPPQFPPSQSASITLDDISPNNRNVLKTKLTINKLNRPVSMQSTANTAKHDLSLLLKQEFDAKNAELNQTKAHTLVIGPSGQVFADGPKVFAVSSQAGIEKLLDNITMPPDAASASNPLSGPPYQLPQSPAVLLNASLSASGSNNQNMKEGVHYRPVAVTLLPPVLTTTSSTTTTTTTPKPNVLSRHRVTTKRPKNKYRDPPKEDSRNATNFVRIRTHSRKRLKTTTSTTTTEVAPVELTQPTPSKVPSDRVTSPKYVSTISTDVRFQVEPSNRPTTVSGTSPPPVLSASASPDSINELELNSDESRLFNTSLDNISDPPAPNATAADDVFIVLTRQTTSYRLTTERLAYILIGSCCGLAVLVLVIVAMSVRCKDMCTEYRTWKSTEKAALRWHRHNRGPRGGFRGPLPYPILGRSRFNLPRYFRTSIDNAKLRPPPMEPFTGANGAPPYGDANKVLDSFLHGSKPEGPHQGCCHCINCSSTWFFRNLNHGGWCCQRGYYQPPRRTKLPFGAASSVNTFMPRFAVEHSGDIKSTRPHMEAEDGISHEPLGPQLHRNASEPNLEMCFSDGGGNHGALGRGLDGRMREKASSSGAIPVKVNMSANRFFAEHPALNATSKCNQMTGRLSAGPLFCEIEDEDDEDEDGPDEAAATDFSNVFETNFGDATSSSHHQHGHNRQRKSKSQTPAPANCDRRSHSFGNLYHQKFTPQSTKHKSDQSGGGGGGHAGEKSRRRRLQSLPDYYNPNTGKYYFDSASIKALDRATNGESSSIWINSSKIVDKLHRKHLNRHATGATEVRNGGQRTAHRRPHHDRRPSTPGPSAGEGSDGNRNQRTSHSHQTRPPGGHCHSHFDPGLFARLGLPGKLTGALDNEQNFVVWNDTSERLI